ncbi:tripartite tricarboxylate transporter TctB family protein [Mesobacterium pallidum]|uniref:tripartite tricarboxylate transporter TctB family protein n=1 Tax=Mesobacterium pallidum TaxID=2872037 RepID=UPI001EE22BB7|nr:tripartite tricarboxylate transporter TctB family protein [Mesobacterium pallidum]
MRFVLSRTEDIIAAVVTAGVGSFIVIEAGGYRMGTLTSMGPGYFPTILGWTMIALAALILVTSRPTEVLRLPGHRELRGMLLVAASFGGFALTIERFGMIPAVTLAVFLAALASERNKLWMAAALGLGSAITCALIFRVGLGLQIEAF